MPAPRPTTKLALGFVGALAGWASTAHAARPSGDAEAAPSTESSKRRAAELYDRAVSLYEQAKYAEAARAFFDADALLPSSDALSSAIAAARLAHDDLLVAQAAQRAATRDGVDPKLAGDARAALSEAETHLARLDLSCDPAPCTLGIEGKPVESGRSYLLPGTHLLTARFGSSSEQVEQRASLAAGALYTIVLVPKPAAERQAAPVGPAESAVSASPLKLATPTGQPHDRGGPNKPLRPWVFYAGVGGTVLLAGVTTWSGLSALSDVDHYKQTRRAADRDDALGSIHGTDWLLAGTVVLAGATAFVGWRLVDFGSGAQAVSVHPAPGGATLAWSGKL
jgi:hypothetical protein